LARGQLLLGDDTGVGKTLSAIGGLTDPSCRPALVVTPGGAVPMQWQDVIRGALPGIRTHILRGATPYDLAAATAREYRRAGADAAPAFPDIVITPYTRIHGWVEVMRDHIKAVVYDEVQELRHADTAANPSRKWKAAHDISVAVDRRLGLSATPTVNYGGEFWNVAECIFPGVLGERAEFDREWCTSGEERKRKLRDPRAFGLYLREQGLMLRRTRKDVGREMPPLTIAPTRIDADPAELERIKGRATELARVILAQSAGKGAGLDKMQKAGELDRVVRQATGIAKAPFIADFIRWQVEQGEPVLVGLWHRSVYDIVNERLADLAPAFYTGEESPKQKQEALRRFKERETPVLCMSLRSGAAIDGLQYVCRTVIIGELDWSHVIHHQLISRVDRDGQTDKVVAYYLLSDLGSDPVVADVCGAKRANSEPIRNPNATTIEGQTVDPDHTRRLAETYLKGR